MSLETTLKAVEQIVETAALLKKQEGLKSIPDQATIIVPMREWASVQNAAQVLENLTLELKQNGSCFVVNSTTQENRLILRHPEYYSADFFSFTKDDQVEYLKQELSKSIELYKERIDLSYSAEGFKQELVEKAKLLEERSLELFEAKQELAKYNLDKVYANAHSKEKPKKKWFNW